MKTVIMGHRSMKKLFGLSALVSPRVALGVGAVLLTSVVGGTGCGLSYSLTGLYIEPGTGLTCLYPSTEVYAQYNAYGTYTEGGHTTETKDLTAQVTWSVSIPIIASVTSTGQVTPTANAIGTSPVLATIPGEFGTLVATSNVQVSTQCVPTGSLKPALRIVPASQTLKETGDTEKPLALVFDASGGKPADVTRQVMWTSNNSQVATVDHTGLITGVGPGDATITAETRLASGELVSAAQTVHLGANN